MSRWAWNVTFKDEEVANGINIPSVTLSPSNQSGEVRPNTTPTNQTGTGGRNKPSGLSGEGEKYNSSDQSW